MRKLTLSTTLAAVLLALAGVASFAQTAIAPADSNAAGMQGMSDMPGMSGAAGNGAMPMSKMGMMPMMMAMMPMMMPMGAGSMAGMPGAPVMAPAMAQTADQAGIDAKLNLLITSIETLTKRIAALEAKSAN